jgi:TonB family protein
VHILASGLTRRGIAVWMLCGLAAPAWAADDSAQPPGGAQPAVAREAREPLFAFDIPAQPLDAALYRYGDISRQPALFPSDMITGLMSSAVHGSYPAAAALRLLLEGTGLEAEKVASAQGDIFLLRKSGAGAVAPADDRVLDGYPALIQARVVQALCADARTAPGSYRALFSVQVDADGRVGEVRLIDPSGDGRRDAALLSTLRQVRIGMPPPSAAMQQPFTMALSPTGAAAASPCVRQAGGRQP